MKTFCPNCQAPITFDRASLGQFITCGSCGAEVQLDMTTAADEVKGIPGRSLIPDQHDGGWLRVLIIGAVGAIIIGLFALVIVNGRMVDVAIRAAQDLAAAIGLSVVALVWLGLGILAFILACFWTWFPIMVYRQLARLNKTASAILEELKHRRL